jgi:5,10-methylenetetrahydromethanopterin reductase
MSKNPVGYILLTSTPPEEVRPTAALVEDLGFGELWVAEDYFAYGGFVASEAALSATKEIAVGLGIVSSVARHPAVTAMEIASVSRSYPGRFTAGIGHGVPFWTNQMGIQPKSPLTSMEECVTGVRDLLAGETVSREGAYFTFRDIKLSHPAKEEVPIVTGVVGPKSLELSGRIADGTIMSVLAGPTYLRQALTHIRTGMDSAGRTKHSVPVLSICSVSTDRDAARQAVRPLLATYMAALGAGNGLTGPLGWNEKIVELLDAGGVENLAGEMPDEWIDELGIAGAPEDITRGINRLLEAGATSVVLTFDPGSAVEQLRLVSEHVLPLFDKA